jgi:hypothetical protein
MKEETQPSQGNTGNHGGGVFAWGGKACGKVQMSTKRPLCQRKTEGEPKKGLADLWRGKESRKRPTLVVGKKPYGKSQFKKKAV